MKTTKKPNNAIIYCRVSSKKQTENYSLQNQRDACMKYAIDHGLIVTRVFENKKGESAKTMKRDALEELLQFVAKNYRSLRTIIVLKIDRLARDMGDLLTIDKFCMKYGVSIRSVTEPTDDSPSGRFIRNIHGAAANYDNDIRIERTIAGMQSAVSSGRWPLKPPMGYRMSKDSLHKSILVPDDKADIVRDAFDMAAKGTYSQREICRKLRDRGFKIYEQRLGTVLRNQLYKGYIMMKWLEEPIKGIHEPLVSEELFDHVQLILSGKRRYLSSHVRNRVKFPLRRFIVCEKCNKTITASKSTGRGGKRYAYYHCGKRKCGFGSVKHEHMHLQFEQLLKNVSPHEEFVDLFSLAVNDVWQNRHDLKKKKEKKN